MLFHLVFEIYNECMYNKKNTKIYNHNEVSKLIITNHFAHYHSLVLES